MDESVTDSLKVATSINCKNTRHIEDYDESIDTPPTIIFSCQDGDHELCNTQSVRSNKSTVTFMIDRYKNCGELKTKKRPNLKFGSTSSGNALILGHEEEAGIFSESKNCNWITDDNSNSDIGINKNIKSNYVSPFQENIIAYIDSDPNDGDGPNLKRDLVLCRDFDSRVKLKEITLLFGFDNT